jgi:hypothetical protein
MMLRQVKHTRWITYSRDNTRLEGAFEDVGFELNIWLINLPKMQIFCFNLSINEEMGQGSSPPFAGRILIMPMVRLRVKWVGLVVRNCIGSYRVINSPAPLVRKFEKEDDGLNKNRPLWAPGNISIFEIYRIRSRPWKWGYVKRRRGGMTGNRRSVRRGCNQHWRIQYWRLSFPPEDV